MPVEFQKPTWKQRVTDRIYRYGCSFAVYGEVEEKSDGFYWYAAMVMPYGDAKGKAKTLESAQYIVELLIESTKSPLYLQGRW